MKKFKSSLVAAAVLAGPLLAASPLLGTSAARADACAVAPVGTYTAGGFSCTVDSLSFSNFVVTTPTSGSGSVTLADFAPYTNGNENGVELTFDASTGMTPNSAADVALTYTVTGINGALISDAFASFTGTFTGTGSTTLGETLSNGQTLNLTASGSTSVTFPPIDSLGVLKDQHDLSGPAGSAESSIIVNAFSTSSGPVPVPEPSSLMLLGSGLAALGVFGIRRRRNV